MPNETAAEEDIGEVTRREAAEREARGAGEEAQIAAKTSIDSYFDRLGHQMKMTKEVSKTAFKVAGTALVLGAANGLGFLAFGIDAPIVSGGFIAGDWLAKWKNKEKITAKDTMVKGITGAILGGYLHHAFSAIHYAGDSLANVVAGTGASSFYTTATSYATKSALTIGALFPGFLYLENNIIYPVLDSKREPFNTKEFMSAWGKATKVIGLPACLNITVMPKNLQIPGAAAIATMYSLTTAKPGEKPKEAEQKAPTTAPSYG